ncbi:MAG: PilZ domain-containing protein [bacterium]
MVVSDRRAHPRYPAWFPINIRVDGRADVLPGMLCDVSLGGALVWGFWSDGNVSDAMLEITFRSASFELPTKVISVERQWDTVILHLKFQESVVDQTPGLEDLIGDLRQHFEAYQVYLAHRADDDPSLGRTATQYPSDRATA